MPAKGSEIEVTIDRVAFAHLPSEQGVPVALRGQSPGKSRFLRLQDQVTVLFQALDASAAARELADAYKAVADAKPPLPDEINAWLMVTNIETSVTCATCRRNLGLRPREESNPGATVA